jgi:hypothetical protein
MILKCSSGVEVKVSLLTCPFFIFRFYVHVTPCGLYIYIYLWVVIGFYLISLEYAKIQTYKLTSSKICSKTPRHLCMAFNLAIIGPRPVHVFSYYLEIHVLAWERQNNAQIHFHLKRLHTITKMNDNINMDRVNECLFIT